MGAELMMSRNSRCLKYFFDTGTSVPVSAAYSVMVHSAVMIGMHSAVMVG